MTRKGISVVIPCLNEEMSIGATVDQALEGIRLADEEGEVTVVDNGSTDRSVETARAHGARICHEARRGYGAALQQGFHNAHFDIAVMGDADLTYDFTRLGDLTRPIREGQTDFVIGNRMRNIRPGAMPWLHRHIGNPLLSMMLRLMFRDHTVKDAHCGMRAIAIEAYLRLHCVTTGMEFASEMFIRAIRAGLRITERDIIYHPRTGDSKLRSFRDGWRHLRFMMLHSPSSMLIVPGMLGWVAGLAIALPFLFGHIAPHQRGFDIHALLTGSALIIIGQQLVLSGLVAKAYAHLSGQRDDRLIAWFCNRFSFEKSILYVSPILLAGLALTVGVMMRGARGGSSSPDLSRLLFLGLLVLVAGIQLVSSAYLFSIMSWPRHVDRLPLRPEDADPH